MKFSRLNQQVAVVSAALIVALSIPSSSMSASVTPSKSPLVQHQRSLHHYRCTLRFFRNHPRLARTRVGRLEVRKAQAQITLLTKRLEAITQTRASSQARTSYASWYGPGLYGNGMACGGTLQTSTMGVANKTLPCGTQVTVCLRRCATVPVVDRGPFVAGREFDLTGATAVYVGLSGVQAIRWWVN